MEFDTVIKNRFFSRAFAARAVEQEEVDSILEAGSIALMAVNKQPVHVRAVTIPDTLKTIKGVTRSNYGVPLLQIVGCRPRCWLLSMPSTRSSMSRRARGTA